MADTYTVKAGDTLSAIARAHNTTYQQLAAINGISNPNYIAIGQVIKLSGSGSSGGGSSSSNAAVIKQFNLQSNVENTLLATWSWDRSNTENYQVEWQYYTKDKVWFTGDDGTTEYKYSTFQIPNNATQVRFRVKPISKKKKQGDSEVSYWTASWTSRKTFNVSNELPPPVPSTPGIEVTNTKLTLTLDNLPAETTQVDFQIVRDDDPKKVTTVSKQAVKTGHVSYSCGVTAGSRYKARCRARRGSLVSDWSAYTANTDTAPAAPKEIITIKALSETEVQLDWTNVTNAESYTIEYTTEKRYFDSSSEVQSKSVDASVAGHAEITGLEPGDEYFFRVRAEKGSQRSPWTPIKSIIIGKKPSAPTTWSSTTTVISGEPLNLYWVHNSEDGSSQKFAYLELTIGDNPTQTIKVNNDRPEEDKDKTSVYSIDTTLYVEGTKILWRVQTAGITGKPGDWSVQRTVDIYAPPTLELSVTNQNGDSIGTVSSFPFYVSALAGPVTQAPVGYHLSIRSNESYETVDNMGEPKTVSPGEEVYSKYFDISNEELLVVISAGNIDLENGIEYTVVCTVSMNSGLTAQASYEFDVSWEEVSYSPNAEIAIETDAYTASIRPYCENRTYTHYQVLGISDQYVKQETVLPDVYHIKEMPFTTTTGEPVFLGATPDSVNTYYCTIEDSTLIEGVTLSVYRREFDGSFTELATGLDNTESTFITDPHPALDYARYRIVATTVDTGTVCYHDIPNYPVGGKSIIIQWDEAWSNFANPDSTDEFSQPPWSGSLLKLPYNIDVSDKNNLDVSRVAYIGRKRPVSYYGTQLGESSSWSTTIPKDDKETLYALRRLSIWPGDVYVREPSGTGYWANISVSFNLNHKSTTVPVSISLTRVEGGI